MADGHDDSDRPRASAAENPELAAPSTAGLTRRSLRGGFVVLTTQCLKIGGQVASVMILARLLAPAEFGLFAMVAVLFGFLEFARDLGLSNAVVQRSRITHGEVSTLFWLGCGLGVAVALTVTAIAPLLAWLYGEPELIRVTAVASFAFVLTALSAQHMALLMRRMRFSRIAVVQVGAELTALASAVIAASAGFGVWALVLQRLVWAGALATGAWAASGWRPGRPGRLGDVREFVSFGGNAAGAMMVGQVSACIDKVLIGWFWGAPLLGVFERAQKFQRLPVQSVNAALTNVALPALSRLYQSEDPQAYRRAYLAAVQRIALILTPFSALLIGAPKPVVDTVLGDQWGEAVPVLAWFGVMSIAMPLTYTLSWLYLSQDRTREMLGAAAVNGVLTVLAAAIALPFGMVWIAAAYAVTGIGFRIPLLIWLAGRRGPVGVVDLWRIVGMATAAASIAASVLHLTLASHQFDNLSPPVVSVVLGLLAVVIVILTYASFSDGRRLLWGIVRLPGAVVRDGARA